jgi:hypothetical protein
METWTLRLAFAIIASGVLAGCTATPSAFDETTYGINRPANSASRGSDAFCRTYASQTTANRIESSGTSGRDTSGFDGFLAQNEGARAYERCSAGRTG